MSKPVDRLESGLEEIAENHMEDIEEEDEDIDDDDDDSYELGQMIYEDERDSVDPLCESASISGDEVQSSTTPRESWPRDNRRGSSSMTMSEFDVSTGDYSSAEYDFPGILADGSSGELVRQAGVTPSRRPSVSSARSAPEQQTGRFSPIPDGSEKRTRRVSYNFPSSSAESSTVAFAEEQPSKGPGHLRKHPQASKRRQSVSISVNARSVMGDSSDLDHPDDATSSSTSSRKTLGRSKSMRRQSVSHRSMAMSSVSGSSGNPVFESIDSAVESLGQGKNEVMSVAAAAAVVAAGAAAGGKRSHTQYSTGDRVLVFVNILNHTNSVDSKEDFTVAPVNKSGYPEGEGNTPDQMHGPWSYILSTVQRVHFDEDFPYYTVVREDTGSAQRADAEWMEPLKSREGQEAAIAAAKRTGRAKEQNIIEKESRNLSSCVVWLTNFFLWPGRFARTALIPFYQKARLAMKVQIARVLFGEVPYACNLRVTGVNLLVMCSFCYLFIEVIQHAFLPASWDCGLTIVSLIVWIILALELFFEWLIRPVGYFDLISSDKAYAPSTARHINRYHLVIELFALLLFVPSFACIGNKECSGDGFLSSLKWSVVGVIGPSRGSAALGRFCLGLTGLRMFGLVRHWKQLWISNAFNDVDFKKRNRGTLGGLFTKTEQGKIRFNGRRKAKVEDEDVEEREATKPLTEEDLRLKKAATIGTALMVVNSHRTMVILMVIMIVLPIILVFQETNPVALKLTELLQANNLALNLTTDSYGESECAYLENAVTSWLSTVAHVQSEFKLENQDAYVLWAQLLPVRCDFQVGGNNNEAGVITDCSLWSKSSSVWSTEIGSENKEVCAAAWNTTPTEPYTDYFADELNIRSGGIFEYHESALIGSEEFSVKVFVNHNNVAAVMNCAFFLMLLAYLLLTIGGLAVLRGDAGRLVLDPLQRMLKIVLRYAENPLAQTPQLRKPKLKNDQSNDFSNDPWSNDSGLDVDDKDQLGNYETEQLINAITKIADLLRKCWGVAGADIITSNLDRTQDGKPVVFNPTVPGKRVYALFGFVGISGFGEVLHAIDKDVMILINDVAKVVHDEVYRWALGDSGQCNKNLGSTFLMVYRIGDFDEVHEKKRLATDVVFDPLEKSKKKSRVIRRRNQGLRRGVQSKKKSHAMHADDTLQLSTLPGIQRFTDRALLGMLKAFAALHRDRAVQAWKKDFRLGCGVGAFAVKILIGMDAGWAVEGAVGSEYKIDATYLSPHVNMAARMMSATKQYGVTLLMSQAVEELLSLNARAKLRHLDTVYVKGSQVKQRIFAYDARHQGVDFFLFERSEEQSDLDADNYTASIWDNDQDLKSMRQHVTAEFSKKFAEGLKLYLAGKWEAAVETLKEADDIMITTVLEEGYIDYNPDEIDSRIYNRDCKDPEIASLRHSLGDGACRTLISYMENRGGVPPSNWDAVRPLTSK